MPAATMTRRTEAADLASIGGDEDEELLLDHDPVPGERIIDLGDGTQEGRFDATMTGDDPTHVAIYDIIGRRFTMPRDWALLRLKKRYPQNHPAYPARKVFYLKPPVEFPVAHLPCLAQWNGGCRKHFHTENAQRVHFQRRHESEYTATKEDETRDRETRMLKAQEQSVALMTRLLERQAGGEVIPQAEIEAAAPSVPAEPADEFSEMSIPEMRAWLNTSGHPLPANANLVKLPGWREYCRKIAAE